MQITVHNTDQIIEVDDDVSARVWAGATESGIPVRALIVAVSPQTNDPEALAAFERELHQHDGEDDRPVHVDLGPCCMCETTEGAVNMVCLDRRCAVPGHGWGCVVCHLPFDGAVAVLCDECFRLYRQQPEYLIEACRGYPGTEGRIPIEELPPGEFAHDMAMHAAPEPGAMLGVGYILAPDDAAITCGRCGMTSYNPHDVAARYCGNCHVFHEDARK
jgi:hypothetical protein